MERQTPADDLLREEGLDAPPRVARLCSKIAEGVAAHVQKLLAAPRTVADRPLTIRLDPAFPEQQRAAVARFVSRLLVSLDSPRGTVATVVIGEQRIDASPPRDERTQEQRFEEELLQMMTDAPADRRTQDTNPSMQAMEATDPQHPVLGVQQESPAGKGEKKPTADTSAEADRILRQMWNRDRKPKD